MKQIAYYSLFGKGKCFVDYEIFDGYMCVFSGVSSNGVRSNGTSTINAVEQIIKVVTEAEKIPLKFYDLQTKNGYAYYELGEYSFDLLVITNQDEPEVIRWVPQPLPPKVLETFKNHIGPNHRLRK